MVAAQIVPRYSLLIAIARFEKLGDKPMVCALIILIVMWQPKGGTEVIRKSPPSQLAQIQLAQAPKSPPTKDDEQLVLVPPSEVFRPVEDGFRAYDPRTAPKPPPSRGGSAPWAEVYKAKAPSVLCLLTNSGIATGFMLEGGMVVTNHHVAVSAKQDEKGVYVEAFRGTMGEWGGMTPLDKQLIKLYVVAKRSTIDLAILRLDLESEFIEEFLQLPPLRIRSKLDLVQPSESVLFIGNAGASLLWALRSGDVQGMSELRDRASILESVVHSNNTSLSDEDLKEILAGELGKTLVIQSSAEAGKGDSGGPLIDEDGLVVGVCTRILSMDDRDTSRYYYIHYFELLDYLDDISAESDARIENP